VVPTPPHDSSALLSYRGAGSTTVDVLAVVVLLLFLAAGWRSGGGRVLGRVLGAVAGIVLGLSVAPLVAPHVPGRPLWVALACAVLGGLLGLIVGAAVGGAVSTVLGVLRLGFLDRAAGALAALVVGLVVCWAAAGACLTWGGPHLADAVRGSALVEVLGGHTPSFSVVTDRVQASR
jgi:uncharacterized membrane protein required for colicin V production